MFDPHIHTRTWVTTYQEFYLVNRGILYTSFVFPVLCAALAGRPQNIAFRYQSRTPPCVRLRARARASRAPARGTTPPEDQFSTFRLVRLAAEKILKKVS